MEMEVSKVQTLYDILKAITTYHRISRTCSVWH